MTELGQLFQFLQGKNLVDIDGRTLGRIVVRSRGWTRALKRTGIGGADPRAAAIDEEITDPDGWLDIVVALILAIGGDPVAVGTCRVDGDARRG